ncbi:TPA: hypothetical protein ACHTOO_001357 [Pseudomonas aeruginosa]
MAIQPVGEVVFEADGRTYSIAACELKQGSLIQNSSAQFKGDVEGWSVSFSAEHVLGEFAWLVSYAMGDDGVCLDSCELVKQPAGVDVTSAMHFQQVEDED